MSSRNRRYPLVDLHGGGAFFYTQNFIRFEPSRSEPNELADNFTLERYSKFTEFKRRAPREAQGNETSSSQIVDEETPQDTFERVYNEINEQLADELLSSVLSMSPTFFERLVVQLMEAMGYGGYFEEQ